MRQATDHVVAKALWSCPADELERAEAWLPALALTDVGSVLGARHMPYLHRTFEPADLDPIIHVMTRFRADDRPEKIDLGVGVYRDATGNTPIMSAVRSAEADLLADQTSKSYLTIAGNAGFLRELSRLVFGNQPATINLVGVQTPGGSGALRLLAELLSEAGGRRLWLPRISWSNHVPLLNCGRNRIETYPCLTRSGDTFDLQATLAALDLAAAGDVVLLHGACHNPTGIDPSSAGWGAISEFLEARGLIPLVDLAYQGFGDGLDVDALGLRRIVLQNPETLVTVSCSKNFGLYRDRVGAAFAVTHSGGGGAILLSQMERAARSLWSMPPDHGAEVVRRILSTDLRQEWIGELRTMRNRLKASRAALSHALCELRLTHLGRIVAKGKGMFAVLPMNDDVVEELQREHGIYVVPGGRVNIAGLPEARIQSVAQAFAACPGGID